MKNPKKEPKYPIGGYAPGNYMCYCSTCKIEFQGDKRAVQCEPCAISMTKEEPKQEIDMSKYTMGIDPYDEQETLEEIRKVERTELFNSIHSVVKKIPRKNVDGDAMDASSCAYELEQLFYKWQQKRMYSEEEVRELVDHYESDKFNASVPLHFMHWFTKNRKK